MRLAWKTIAGILIPTIVGYGSAFVFVVSSAETPSGSGRSLLPCPHSPNCVSSCALERDSTHFIHPFRFEGPPEAAWKALKLAVLSLPRVTLVEESSTYLHVEIRSLIFRFVDDVEFLLVATEKVIHVRSAAQLGYGDLGVNRKRVEKIRSLLGQTRPFN